MSDININNTAVLGGGRVEYDMREAAVSIDEVIGALENMKDNGLEFVVMSSGNYRGPQWQSVGTSWGWVDEDE